MSNSLSIEQKRSQAMQFYLDKGMLPYQAAAMVGNIQWESGFDPNITGDGGNAFGYMQWHPARRKGLKERMDKYGESLGQLEHSWNELQTYENPALKKILATKTLPEAVAAVNYYYERSGDKEGDDEWKVRARKGRHQYAVDALSSYARANNESLEKYANVINWKGGAFNTAEYNALLGINNPTKANELLTEAELRTLLEQPKDDKLDILIATVTDYMEYQKERDRREKEPNEADRAQQMIAARIEDRNRVLSAVMQFYGGNFPETV